jgi:site-specific DNA-methyltransferase (adenine-specific)
VVKEVRSTEYGVRGAEPETPAGVCPACGAHRPRVGDDVSGAGWRMLLGDSSEVLRLIPSGSVAAVITDPPYGSGGDTRSARMQSSGKKYISTGSSYQRTLPDMAHDSDTPEAWTAMMRRVLEDVRRVLRPDGVVVMMCDWRQKPWLWQLLLGAGLRVRGELVWDKGRGSRPYRGGFRNQCEFALWGGVGVLPRSDWFGYGVIAVSTMTNGKQHQTQKPDKLMRELVQICPPGGLVLDPFAGSAATGVACVNTGREFLGVEQVPAYFDLSVARLRAAEAALEGSK